jgi:hypothetical protein
MDLPKGYVVVAGISHATQCMSLGGINGACVSSAQGYALRCVGAIRDVELRPAMPALLSQVVSDHAPKGATRHSITSAVIPGGPGR